MTHSAPLPTTAVILAAGAGRRLGRGPKALLRLAIDGAGDAAADGAADGEPPAAPTPATPTLAARAVATAHQGGCDDVVLVIGAEAAAVRAAAPPDCRVVECPDWSEGIGASLRTGLAAVLPGAAALILLVDMPAVTPAAVARLRAANQHPDALAAASYAGQRGHPVLLGAAHLPAVVATAAGDSGARAYLAAHPPLLVPCDDVAGPADIDTPEDWRDWSR